MVYYELIITIRIIIQYLILQYNLVCEDGEGLMVHILSKVEMFQMFQMESSMDLNNEMARSVPFLFFIQMF